MMAFRLGLEISAVLSHSSEPMASDLRARHLQDRAFNSQTGTPVAENVDGLINAALSILVNQYHNVDGLIAELSNVNQSISGGHILSTRRFELEALQAGQVSSFCIHPREFGGLHNSNVKTTELYSSRPILRRLCATSPQALRSHLRTR